MSFDFAEARVMILGNAVRECLHGSGLSYNSFRKEKRHDKVSLIVHWLMEHQKNGYEQVPEEVLEETM